MSNETKIACSPDDEQLKMELLAMIDEAQNPFDIICSMAKRLEARSGEPTFAEYVSDKLRAVYGYALQDKKLLTDELAETKQRLDVLKERRDSGDFSEEIKTRIGFAVSAHEKKIARLEAMIARDSSA